MKLLDFIKNLFKKEEKVDERKQRVEKAEELFLSGKITTPEEYIAVLDGEEPMAQDVVETILAEPTDKQEFIELTMDRKDSLDALKRDEAEVPTETIDPETSKRLAELDKLRMLQLTDNVLPAIDITSVNGYSIAENHFQPELATIVPGDLRISPQYDRQAVALELLKSLVVGYARPLEITTREHHLLLIKNSLVIADAFIEELKK